MNAAEFRKVGREMVDYIADYLETIGTRRVLPEVKPGYMADLLPDRAPVKPEPWSNIMADVDRVIIPGITHWQHPRFHAYFPAGNSYPSILADMLSDAIGCVGFSWAASPACTELETIVLDWLAKMIGLPQIFWHEHGIGGGVIQGSASECVLVSMLAARHSALEELKIQHPTVDDGVLLSRMVAYCSKLAHSCVEKAGMLSLIKMRELNIDEEFSLRGPVLQKAIDEDRRNGYFPFFVCATLGTTAVCSFDNLEELGLVCDREGLWLHVDAAYAGSALICPEKRHILRGIEHVKSFNMNPNKWMLVNFDCSTMWVSNRTALMSALTVDPLYLRHSHSDKAIDFRHWGIPLSRRFRALKLWFVIRTYGVEGLQNYIREHCRLAKLFEGLVKSDARFEVKGRVTLGLVCFRLKVGNTATQVLLRAINMSGKLHMVPAVINDDYVIRFAVCSPKATDADIKYAWQTISDVATVCSSQSAVSDFDVQTEVDVTDEEEEEEEQDSLVELTRTPPTRSPLKVKDDDVFLFDNNIPSIPSRIPAATEPEATNEYKRRNRLLRMISDPRPFTRLLHRSASVQHEPRNNLGVSDGLSTSWADGQLLSGHLRNGMTTHGSTAAGNCWNNRDGLNVSNDSSLMLKTAINGYGSGGHSDQDQQHQRRTDAGMTFPPHRARCLSDKLPGGRPKRCQFVVDVDGIGNNNSVEYSDLEQRYREVGLVEGGYGGVEGRPEEQEEAEDGQKCADNGTLNNSDDMVLVATFDDVLKTATVEMRDNKAA
jgi:aromatic-L-amino-acid decarboxylase